MTVPRSASSEISRKLIDHQARAYCGGDWQFGTQCFGGMTRPIGIAEHFSCEKDHVGLTGGDNCVGLRGIGDHADCAGGNTRFLRMAAANST